MSWIRFQARMFESRDCFGLCGPQHLMELSPASGFVIHQFSTQMLKLLLITLKDCKSGVT